MSTISTCLEERLRSNVYIVPHAALPFFKLGKANDVILRFKPITRENKWDNWRSSYDWKRGVRLNCASERRAFDIETSLRKLMFMQKAQAGPNGPKGVEWHKIDALGRLLRFIKKAARDYEYDIHHDLEELAASGGIRSPSSRKFIEMLPLYAGIPEVNISSVGADPVNPILRSRREQDAGANTDPEFLEKEKLWAEFAALDLAQVEEDLRRIMYKKLTRSLLD